MITGCSYAPWYVHLQYLNFNLESLTSYHSRANCPTGKTSVFAKAGVCFIGKKQYCCPDPTELAACHWSGGSAGEDCANAKCNATELEIDRDQFGGSELGGCSCKSKWPDWMGKDVSSLTDVLPHADSNSDRWKNQGSLLYRGESTA